MRGGWIFFFKIHKRASMFIREMRVMFIELEMMNKLDFLPPQDLYDLHGSKRTTLCCIQGNRSPHAKMQ